MQAGGQFPGKADNEFVREFDKQLGEIEDQTSAEKAVNTFVDHVDSRLDKSALGPGAQSVRVLMTLDLIQQIAQAEVAARKGEMLSMFSAMGEGEEEVEFVKPLIDPGTVTDNLNELVADEDVWISDETIETAKAVVEGSLPNLNPEGKSEMTPLGACVLGYAVASEDDGSAAESSVKIAPDKVSTYIENISQ